MSGIVLTSRNVGGVWLKTISKVKDRQSPQLLVLLHGDCVVCSLDICPRDMYSHALALGHSHLEDLVLKMILLVFWDSKAAVNILDLQILTSIRCLVFC